MRVSQFSLSVLSVAICSQLYAQNAVAADGDTNSTSTLPTLVVTATRTPTSIAEIAGTVQKIDSEQIQQQSASGRKIADILAQLVPSLGASSGTTSNFGQTMRGRQIQVLIDGVPQTGSRDVSRQLNSISPALIERVEVVSGASSIYGSGATGGIINIITKRNQGDALSFESKVGVTAGHEFSGDAIAYEAAQTMSFAKGAVDGFLGATYTKRGDQQDSRGERIAPEPGQTDRRDTETVDVTGRLNFKLSDLQTLSFGAQYYNDEQDSKYAPDYYREDIQLEGPYAFLNPINVLVPGGNASPSYEAIKGLQLANQPFTERYAANAQYENKDIFGQKLNAEAYYRKENSRFYPFVSPNLLALQSESEIEVAGLRTAMQSKFDIANKQLDLTYGVDYEQENDKQNADRFDLSTFVASHGLKHSYSGTYDFGPEVDIEKLGFFVQSKFSLTDDLNLQAGIRHERISSDSGEFTPLTEAVSSKTPRKVAAGTVKHNETLFNLGAVYYLNDQQQVFANFSQGFSLPDLQRVLRDVPVGFVVNSNNVDPIKVNNYELGWRLQGDNNLNLGLTGFYNTSDKVTQFARDFSVRVADTDERIYGAEANVSVPVYDQFSVGGTLAYTRGQFKDAAGDWRELNAFRVSPVKGTLFGEWNDQNGNGLRLQMLAIGGSNKAYKDSLEAKYDNNVRANTAADIKGYAVMDVLAHTEAFKGRVDFGIYNFWNSKYRTVYSQEAVSTYGAVSGIPAEGRTYALSYTIKY